MKELTIELQKREVTGKAVKRLRTAGVTPAVIHDHGKESVVVEGQSADLVKIYKQAGGNHTVEVKVGAKNYTALIKNATFDPRNNRMTHLVFNAVSAHEKVTAEVPVHIRFAEGNESTPAERAGFVVLHQLDSVEVESVPSALPDALYFDGEKLVTVGDHATVADLEVPEGVVVKEDASQPIATVFEPSSLQAANDAVGGGTDATAPAAATEAAPATV